MKHHRFGSPVRLAIDEQVPGFIPGKTNLGKWVLGVLVSAPGNFITLVLKVHTGYFESYLVIIANWF